MEVRTHRALVGLFALLLGTVWSCATATNDEATVRDTEAKLEDAGFIKVLVDTPSEELEHITTFKLNQYQTASGTVFWYYDPDYCQCLFEGNQAEAERYQLALEHANDLAQYQENETMESATQQGLMASAFNGAVPSPFFWGGWGAWYGYGVGYYGGSGGSQGGGLHNPKPGGGTGKGGGGLGGGGGHIGGGGHGFGGGGGFGHGGFGHSGGGHR
ncbi:MAG: hypothetical protein JO121_22975 [Deltaproteobacteria bacterium]|jgi:hypothetical protein|nr:hypothetical protein [Deltaproteobacteria bacterium]